MDNNDIPIIKLSAIKDKNIRENIASQLTGLVDAIKKINSDLVPEHDEFHETWSITDDVEMSEPIKTDKALEEPVDPRYSGLKRHLTKGINVKTVLKIDIKDFNSWYNTSTTKDIRSALSNPDNFKIENAVSMEPVNVECNGNLISKCPFLGLNLAKSNLVSYVKTWVVEANLELITKEEDLTIKSWQNLILSFNDQVASPNRSKKPERDEMTIITLIYIYLTTHPVDVKYGDKTIFNSKLYDQVKFEFDFDFKQAYKVFDYDYVCGPEDSTKVRFRVEFKPSGNKGLSYLGLYSKPAVYPWKFNRLALLARQFCLPVVLNSSKQNVICKKCNV